MNRQSSLPTGPHKITRLPSPGVAPSVRTAGVRKPRPVVANDPLAPAAASTRMYGKAAPAAPVAPGMLPMGGPSDV